MPAIPWIIGSVLAGLTGLLGFVVGGGVQGAGAIVKYGVIGVIAYFTAKQFGWVK